MAGCPLGTRTGRCSVCSRGQRSTPTSGLPRARGGCKSTGPTTPCTGSTGLQAGRSWLSSTSLSEETLYHFQEPVRPKAVVFLVGFTAFWLAALIIFREPFTVEFAVGTVVWIGLVCHFTSLIVKGGKWRMEVTEQVVRWHGPGQGDRTIRHADVESFEVVERPDSPSKMCVRLKSGETVFIPEIGDWHALYGIFLTKWRFLGWRRVR